LLLIKVGFIYVGPLLALADTTMQVDQGHAEVEKTLLSAKTVFFENIHEMEIHGTA
jgi:hypothetical protein